MARAIVAGFVVFGVIAMGTVGHAGQAAPAGNAAAKALKNPIPADAASIDAGKAIFARFCRSCHGPEGKGDGTAAPQGSHPANFTDAKWDHGGTDGEIYTTIHDGVGPKFDMDAWEGRIQDKDIWNVVNFLKTLGPKQ